MGCEFTYTTAAVSWSVSQRRRSTSRSIFSNSMLRPESSPIHANTIKGLSHFQRRELHWLNVVDRVRFRVCVQVHKCLHNMAPGYLSTLYQPVFSVPGRRHFRSARHSELDFPRVNLATYRGRVLAYAGPTSWNSLLNSLKNINLTLQTFKRHLKTFLFSTY